MQDTELKEIRQRLIEIADSRGVEYKTILQGEVAQNDILAVSALASLLDIDVREALTPSDKL